ncbi:putative metal-dependent HD superfamily phosphohydrolase [Catenuloplanes nepalensis]|uniref:Metal-dependent HD superfamily phosphohydrolase n=1 Tax=Catenuloplanes nepalensis TaxID=587533 RepID=A0ABT9N3A4_9ACTN|nr:metal-dependent phosphohydrolase [Catenuloplanes nepalensis]MDP9798131.1 putative metal-dependent HD superfamily phosphohydrolase [Catenuloplanes nepalensis]
MGDFDLMAGWRGALAGAGGTDPDDRAGAALLARWREPHRAYHDEAHLTSMLSTVDSFAEKARDPDLVRLAVWFHDAIYDPTSSSNEEASALLATSELAALGVGADATAEVARLVRLTAGHAVADGDPNGALLCDADLEVLARPTADYELYTQRVRREYAHVPDELFRLGRAAVLRGLLGLPALFRDPELAARWEAPARANLSRELAALTA